MQAASVVSEYILRRQGRMLSGTYLLSSLHDDRPLLFIHEKAERLFPTSIVHVYADEGQNLEILRLTEGEAEDVEMEVIDSGTGRRIGAFALEADELGDYMVGNWLIMGADGKPIGRLVEKSGGRYRTGDEIGVGLPQKMDITVGGAVVGELRQKVKMASYELVVDFTGDVAHLLDRRLGIAAAIFAALRQAKQA